METEVKLYVKSGGTESENADCTGKDLNLHIAGTEQIPEERDKLKGDLSEVCHGVPGKLLEYVVINTLLFVGPKWHWASHNG